MRPAVLPDDAAEMTEVEAAVRGCCIIGGGGQLWLQNEANACNVLSGFHRRDEGARRGGWAAPRSRGASLATGESSKRHATNQRAYTNGNVVHLVSNGSSHSSRS